MTAAARKRRHRHRQRLGLVPVQIELDREALDVLRARNLISAADLDDPHRLAARLGSLLSRVILGLGGTA